MLKFLVVYDDASKRVAEWSWLLLVTFCYWIFTVSRNSWHGTARSSRCAADGTFLLWSDWFGCDFSTLWCRYGWCELMRMWMMIYVGERKFIIWKLIDYLKVNRLQIVPYNKKSKQKDREIHIKHQSWLNLGIWVSLVCTSTAIHFHVKQYIFLFDKK